MSRTFLDDELRVWEVYPSGSRRGFAEKPAVIFLCISDRALRARFVDMDGDVADAERSTAILPDQKLKEMLNAAQALP
jgi:hypothetical protein